MIIIATKFMMLNSILAQKFKMFLNTFLAENGDLLLSESGEELESEG